MSEYTIVLAVSDPLLRSDGTPIDDADLQTAAQSAAESAERSLNSNYGSLTVAVESAE